MNGKVQEAIDWRTAKPTELDGARCILMTQTGTIIDGRLKASPPRDMRILSISPKHETAILQPHIKTLTVLKG